MNSFFTTFLKKYSVTIVLSLLLGSYVVFSGMNRSCGLCTMATDFIGLTEPPPSFGESPKTPAPEWSAVDLDGNPVASSAFDGKVVLVGFWATWCPPCRREIPEFIDLQEKHGNDGLVVVGLSVDQKGPEAVKAFAEEMGINYPVLMADAALAQAFGGVRSIPTTFLIDRSGQIVARNVGYWSRDQLERELLPLL
jgi:thiol-disulfide isomerase/thioredoxin